MSGYNFNTWAIELTADTRKFMKNIKEANKTMMDFAKNASKASSSINGAFSKSSMGGIKAMNLGFKGLLGNILKLVSLYKILQFASESITLGADLTEVQHVVDEAFPKMKGVVNDFASTAIDSFGMSELSAKRYTGTLGAMLQSMGLTEKASAGMSMDMVKLAGDLASFYNMKPEETFNKIRSGISGQVMPLKQLGINMNIANLEAYAMANGIQTSYREMSQAEKTMLRYQYLVSVTGTMQGDFAATSGTWANQTKILTQRFEQLKASLGQGFIMALLPVLKVINILMAKLVGLANMFTGFMRGLTGKSTKDISASVGKINEAAGSVGTGYSDMADGIASGAEKKADKAEKKAKKAKKTMLSVLSFDKLNKLSDPNEGADASSGAGGGKGGGANLSKKLAGLNGGIGSISVPSLDMSDFDLSAGVFEEKGANLAKSFKEKLDLIKKFWEEHKIEVLAIVGALAAGILFIFGRPLVAQALNFMAPVLKNVISTVPLILVKLGQLITNPSLIFEGVKKIFVGGFELLKAGLEFLISPATLVTAAIILFVAALADLYVTCEDFRNSVNESFGALGTVLVGIFNDIGQSLNEFWANYGEPIVNGLVEGWERWKEVVKVAWEEVLKPIFDSLTKALNIIWKNVLKPALDVILTLVGELVTIVLTLWNKALMPVLKVLLKIIGFALKPLLAIGLDIIDFVTDLIKTTLDFVKMVIKNLGMAIKFLINGLGVFYGAIEHFVDNAGEILVSLWDGIVKIFGDIGTWFSDRFDEAVEGIKNAFKGIGEWFEGVWNSILSVFSKGGKIFEGIKEGVSAVFKTAVNWIIKGVNKVVAAPFKFVNGILNSIRNFDIPIIGKVFAGLWKNDPVPVPQIPMLASGGTVETGQLFLAREKGPELVGGGNGRSTVMNNDQIVQAVSDGVSSAVMEVLMAMKQNDTSTDEPTTITMEIDGEKIGVAAIKGVNKRNERYRTKLAII
jgi:hypothetical protein